MKKLIAALCLILAVTLGSMTRGESADALREWEPLAKLGNAVAQYNLGQMYIDGNGVPKDYIRAHMWADLAASSGIKLAGIARDTIAKRMTPADISAAQKLARECVRKKYKGC